MVMIGICLCAGAAQAQLFNELFRQKATQRKYLAEQIAFLQLHLSTLKKGYDIAREGIGFVDQLKKGEFNLHDVFFTSLKTVTPAIRGSTTVTTIVQSLATSSSCLTSHRKLLRSPSFAVFQPPDNLQEAIRKRFLQVEQLTLELLSLITSGSLELTDDQRNQRLETLLQQCRTLENNTRKDEQSSKLLLIQYMREAAELEQLRRLYNL